MDGVLIVDKPAGLTSHDVVVRVRRIFNQRRVGHTGTLDPFATGVLVVLVGKATRLAQFLSGHEKEYEATIRLGYATETGDITGTRLQQVEPINPSRDWTQAAFTAEQIETALESLRGHIEQVPPMYSAKRIDGRKLYELARRGEEVERASVSVDIYEFETIKSGGNSAAGHHDGTPDLRVRVVSSAGTYIRTLAEDFGRRLGVGAHLVELRRTRAGDFRIDVATSLGQLELMATRGSLEGVLISPAAALSRLPFLHLTVESAQRARNGVEVRSPAVEWPDGEKVRMLDDAENLIGVGYFDATRKVIRPRIVFPVDKTEVS